MSTHREDFIQSIYTASKGHPDILLESLKFYAEKLKKISLKQYIKVLLTIKLLENILRGIALESKYFEKNNIIEMSIIFDTEDKAIVPLIKYFNANSMN